MLTDYLPGLVGSPDGMESRTSFVHEHELRPDRRSIAGTREGMLQIRRALDCSKKINCYISRRIKLISCFLGVVHLQGFSHTSSGAVPRFMGPLLGKKLQSHTVTDLSGRIEQLRSVIGQVVLPL
jgi:hypothetical protein